MPLEELVRLGSPRPIVRWGTPVMHRRCRPVTAFGPDLWNLLCDMFATNTAAHGAGLAAPQIGVDLAVFVFDCLDAAGRHRQGLVCNPVTTTDRRPRFETVEEGCLSLPGAYMPLARPDVAVCRGQDQFGEPIEVVGTGTLGRCLQHETDHVNGIVMEDHLGPAEQQDLRRQHDLAATRYPTDWPAQAPDSGS
jgi:peptide deformylase